MQLLSVNYYPPFLFLTGCSAKMQMQSITRFSERDVHEHIKSLVLKLNKSSQTTSFAQVVLFQMKTEL